MARIQRLSHVLLCHLPHTPFFVLTFVNSALAMTCSLVAPHPHWKVAPTVVLLSKGVRVQFVTHDGRPARQASAQAAMMVPRFGGVLVDGMLRSTAAQQTVRGQIYSARIVAGHGKRNTRQEPTQTTTDFRAQARFPTDHVDDLLYACWR